MKIVALNPPYFPLFSRASRSPAVTKSATLYYPFFLSYATGVLEDAGFDVGLLDAPAAGWDRGVTIEKIRELSPELVICETSTPSIENDLEVMKEIKNKTGSFIVAVGTHVSALPDEILNNNPWVDAIARKEYEYTVRELACRIKKNGKNADLNGINGLSFRNRVKIVHNRDRELIENLDELPFVSRVYRDHLRPYINSYFYGSNLTPVITILSGRGCPHQCAYCVYPQTMTGHKYRLRSVNNLIEELLFVKKELPEVKEIFIEDDTLTVNKERAQQICREIIKNKLKIPWAVNSRADVDFETMKIMQKAGCRSICVGFESSSQEILDKLGKRIDHSKYFKFRKEAKQAGLLVHGCFMYGNEGETKETMRETLEMAKKLDCDTAQFYPIMVYPGTKAYDEYKRRGYITAKSYRDWLTADGLHNCVVSLPGITTRELVEFCDLSRKEFYLRPKYFLSTALLILKKPKEFKRIFKAASALKKYIFPLCNK